MLINGMQAVRSPSGPGPLSRPPGCGRGPAAACPSPAPPAGPPGRLAARQGFVVVRSFRAAAAVPSRPFGRPAPGRAVGRLPPSLCSVLPRGPVGPAPPRPPWARLLRAGGPVPARRSLAGLAALARLRSLVGFAARGPAPGLLLSSRSGRFVAVWGRGPGRPGLRAVHTAPSPRAARATQPFDIPKYVKSAGQRDLPTRAKREAKRPTALILIIKKHLKLFRPRYEQNNFSFSGLKNAPPCGIV